jgi:hypothetical protein
VGYLHPLQLILRVAVDQFCTPIDVQDDCRRRAMVDDKDADRRVLKQMTIALFAFLVCVNVSADTHAECAPSAINTGRLGKM